ncbi:MAG: hypothetical protein KDK71_10610, partial [Chlamydiia bacterium]|nr:hypothetical protein [Chlamydiia bacterium]
IIKPESDNVYVAGLDLGIKHDHSGVVVLGVNIQQRKIRLATFKGFTPYKGEVDLTEVMSTVKHLHDVFHLRWVGYDPWQAKLMAQMLTKKRVPMQEVSFSSTKNLEMMANNLLDVLKNDILEGYDENDRLLTDLGKLNILEKRYGLKLDSVSDSTGHADVATALVIALLRAVPMLGGLTFSSDDSLDWNDDRPLQEAELNALPDEFKELMDMDF